MLTIHSVKCRLGIGHLEYHIWPNFANTFRQYQLLSFDDYDNSLTPSQLFYLEEVFYIFSMSLLKVSVLLFYLKVFPKRGFRHAVYIMAGLNIVYAMVYGFVVIFQCTPVNGAWLSWDKEYNSRCMNQNILGWSTASINIALDLATIALPLPSLAKLKMPMRKKLQIMLMFAVGIL